MRPQVMSAFATICLRLLPPDGSPPRWFWPSVPEGLSLCSGYSRRRGLDYLERLTIHCEFLGLLPVRNVKKLTF